jgi:hypothetical protein
MKTPEWKRLQYAEPQDLRNIMRDYHLNIDQLHVDDATSVQLWVDSMSSLEEHENPILCYKPVGEEDPEGLLEKEDFMLAFKTEFPPVLIQTLVKKKFCLDSTHGVNDHSDLTTAMTVDECGAGLPIAFCLCNRKHTGVWIKFYRAIKQEYGVIETETFMSDDDPAFYNAWCSVMGAAERQLLCSWHINKNLEANLHSKTTCSPEKRKEVSAQVRAVIEETNTIKFHEDLLLLEHSLLCDPELEAFGTYFTTKYSKCPEKWAYCYRINAGINTNMYLEALHKVFKYFYLDGRKNKRVDKCIAALLRFSRDKIFNRAIMLVKNKSSKRMLVISKNHKRSLEITGAAELITVVRENKEWIVMSRSSKEKKYAVMLRDTPPCDMSECRLRCKHCKVCIHQVMCTCLDNLIRDTICVHIHLCLQNSTTLHSEPTFSDATATLADIDKQQDMINDLATSAVVASKIVSSPYFTDSSSHSKELSLIVTKSQLVTSNLMGENEYDEDEIKTIHSALDKLLSMTNKRAVNLFKDATKNKSDKKSSRSVKRLSPQKRFAERKAKSRPSLSLTKISMEKRQSIISDLRAPLDS